MPGVLIVVLVLGAIGLFLALPGGRLEWTRLGLVSLAASGGALVFLIVDRAAGEAGLALFIGGALVALFSAVRIVTHRKPVYSALYFVLLVVAVAGLLIGMQAEFLAAALVIVYAGAILVTYVFVIMLAQKARPPGYDSRARDPFWGCLAGFALLAVLGRQLFLPAAVTGDTAVPGAGTVEAVGTALLTQYVVGLQVIGLLLLAALVGAIAIARRRVTAAPEPELEGAD